MFLKKISQFFGSKNKLSFKVIKDIEEAQKWWEVFSPHNYIYDEWDFRYCFYKYHNYELFFYVGYVGDEPIGLLPLQWNPEKKYLEFFGGNPMNENRVFYKKGSEKYVADFFKAIPGPAYLSYMTGADPHTSSLPIVNHKYILPLEGLTNGHDYIERDFQGETKKKLLKRIAKVAEHTTELLINNFEDIELMFEFNINNFKEKSAFLMPYRKEVFRDLRNLGYELALLTYMINNKKQGVSFALIYRDQFVSFYSGMHPEAVKDIDSFARLQRINYAIKKNMRVFDSLSGNCGWKEGWKFRKIPQYIFEKK